MINAFFKRRAKVENQFDFSKHCFYLMKSFYKPRQGRADKIH
jgi:hypothetical protein